MMTTASDFLWAVVAVARREPVRWTCSVNRQARRRSSSRRRIPCSDLELWKPSSA